MEQKYFLKYCLAFEVCISNTKCGAVCALFSVQDYLLLSFYTHYYRFKRRQTSVRMGEDVKVDGMYMENLEEWIEEEDLVVTYKYISRNLKVHVNVAKQMLYNFVASRKSSESKLGVVYLVSGLVPR